MMASAASIVAGVIILIIIIALAAYALSTAGPAKSAYTSTTANYSTTAGTTANTTANASAPTSVAPSSSNTTAVTTTNATSNAATSVKVGYNATVGNYLTDGKGYTLYIFLNDTPYSGKSTCAGFCASIWPAFYAANVSAAGLNPTAFSAINGTNSTMQLAYYGRPLYLYSGDSSPGQMNGLGLLNKWYPVSPTGNVIK